MGLLKTKNLNRVGRSRLNFELVSLFTSRLRMFIIVIALLASVFTDGPFKNKKLRIGRLMVLFCPGFVNFLTIMRVYYRFGLLVPESSDGPFKNEKLS